MDIDNRRTRSGTNLSNFKNEVANSLSCDHGYIHALHQVWSVMRKLQDESVAVPAPKFRTVSDEDPLKDIIWDGITKAKTLAKEGRP
jgi:hypothetical protein